MKLASIEKLHSIQPHPNPEVEKLEVGLVKAWPVVIPKNTYSEGELVVFIVIDSIVPNRPEFAFMERQKFRVWNARFKGSASAGLVMPLSLANSFLQNVSDGIAGSLTEVHDWVEGEDVSELIGVTKYERPFDPTMGGKQKGNFPTDLISITDQENGLSYPEVFSELEDGEELYITQKADGSSTTFITQNGSFKACSRRFEMMENEGFPWSAANKYDLKNKMLALNRNLAIQCEAVGNKLNGNRMKINGIELRLFRAKNLDTNKIYDYMALKELANLIGIPMVQEIDIIKYDKSIHTIEYFRNLADKQKWPINEEAAEGIVVACVIPKYSSTLRTTWSIKFINQNYSQN